MDNIIIFLFFLCIFSLAAFVVNIINRLEKIEKENNKLKSDIDDLNVKIVGESIRIKYINDKVNNYKPYNEEERKEICKALEQDMINVLKNVDKFIQGDK